MCYMQLYNLRIHALLNVKRDTFFDQDYRTVPSIFMIVTYLLLTLSQVGDMKNLCILLFQCNLF